jgi:serine/threonine protein kinase
MESTLSRPDTLELQNYELLDVIGEGSMACVRRGRRRADGLPVAIKVPYQAVMGNKILRERFHQEFRAGQQLNHPNIVRAIDCFEEAGNCFLVMELVDGPDLWQRITSQGRLPEAEAIGIITQIAQGLHELHRHGIIHRDVKPDNILLHSDGTAKLADLGLIKDLENEIGLTCPHKGLGTPNFMAPEQFSEARHADVRCDIYSLGAALYTAVTGVLPFEGKMGEMLRKKLANDLVPPRKLVPSLSEALDWAIRRAVHTDPQVRPASCPEFCQLLKGEAVPATARIRRPTRDSRPDEDRRRAVRYACTLATVCEVVTTIHSVRDDGIDHWQGEIVNLSVGGIGLVLDRRFEPGTIAAMTLENPRRAVKHDVEIKVVRVISDGNRRWFIGATFASPLNRDELRNLLD